MSVPDFKARNTISYARVTSDDEDGEEQKKAAPGSKLNSYRELKLENTSIFKRISNTVGLQAAKKGKATTKTGTAKKTSKVLKK